MNGCTLKHIYLPPGTRRGFARNFEINWGASCGPSNPAIEPARTGVAMYPTFLLCSRATASGHWHEARDRRGLEQARSSQPEPELGRLPVPLGASSVRRRTSRRLGRHVDGKQAPTLNGTLRRRRLPVRASWHGLGQCSCQSRCPWSTRAAGALGNGRVAPQPGREFAVRAQHRQVPRFHWPATPLRSTRTPSCSPAHKALVLSLVVYTRNFDSLV
jgi:hypothetical protein